MFWTIYGEHKFYSSENKVRLKIILSNVIFEKLSEVWMLLVVSQAFTLIRASNF